MEVTLPGCRSEAEGGVHVYGPPGLAVVTYTCGYLPAWGGATPWAELTTLVGVGRGTVPFQ